ncbi:uncharacterized protein LOC121872788 [Homarus americanus]|uniref:uncharacterized protein LOC121872788 n=1 Tax=Homarus americanus TaxID=6706 RepID=UPI001C47BD05|nr:uncharacterized protein LOC121872788 [Homarus americanus]
MGSAFSGGATVRAASDASRMSGWAGPGPGRACIRQGLFIGGTMSKTHLRTLEPREDIVEQIASQNISRTIFKLQILSYCGGSSLTQELQELIGECVVQRKLSGPDGKAIYAVIGFLRTIPKEVLLGWDTVPVKPYIPRPIRCCHCQRYGHTAKKCRAREVCATCRTTGHHLTSCQATQKKCTVCDGPHSSFDRECPKWREECRIAKLRYEKKISYKEASLRVKKKKIRTKKRDKRKKNRRNKSTKK